MDLQIEGNKDLQQLFRHDFSYGQIGLTKYFNMVLRTPH